MSQDIASLASRPVALMDQVSVGVLVEAVPRDRVDAAVDACGVRELRRGGKLPAHVAVYLTMGLCLFPDDPQDEVALKVTGSLSVFGVWDASWQAPTSSAVTQARKRIGPEVVRRVFELVAAPVAEYGTPGGFLRSWRVTAIDGFSLDVPDTPRTRRSSATPRRIRADLRFRRPGWSRWPSAAPTRCSMPRPRRSAPGRRRWPCRCWRGWEPTGC